VTAHRLSPFFANRLTGPDQPEADELIREYLTYACGGLEPEGLDPALAAPDMLWGEGSRALVRFTKHLFNYYFRYDLYGPNRRRDFLVLSSGSMHEPTFGLVPSMKRCLEIALERDWYGYSDSRGRVNARASIARLENQRLGVESYSEDSVAITLGGTFAVSCLVDYLTKTLPAGAAVCAIPNYPPLVESVAQRMPLRLVDTHVGDDGCTSINSITEAITDNTRIVLLQSVTNPTGLPISEAGLECLISSLGPLTYLILDEAHECLGELRLLSKLRTHPRVIRVASLSKQLSVPGMKVGWILAAREFVDDFYEYASTIYGGPASFFYSLVDVYATFEYVKQSGTDAARSEALSGIAVRYNLSPTAAQKWYVEYSSERDARDANFLAQRTYAVDTLRAAGYAVTNPRYSVNCTVAIDGRSSYGFFRKALDQFGVSVYPNILTFDLADSSVRVTLGRDFGELKLALDRLGQIPSAASGWADAR